MRTPLTKCFKLLPEQIRPLATGRGGVIATDRITADGSKVGYMYRISPQGEHDSGWVFLAGDESDAYMEQPRHFEAYDVNTVANYDPEIIPLLDAPIGSAFARTGDKLAVDPAGAPEG